MIRLLKPLLHKGEMLEAGTEIMLDSAFEELITRNGNAVAVLRGLPLDEDEFDPAQNGYPPEMGGEDDPESEDAEDPADAEDLTDEEEPATDEVQTTLGRGLPRGR